MCIQNLAAERGLMNASTTTLSRPCESSISRGLLHGAASIFERFGALGMFCVRLCVGRLYAALGNTRIHSTMR